MEKNKELVHNHGGKDKEKGRERESETDRGISVNRTNTIERNSHSQLDFHLI